MARKTKKRKAKEKKLNRKETNKEEKKSKAADVAEWPSWKASGSWTPST